LQSLTRSDGPPRQQATTDYSLAVPGLSLATSQGLGQAARSGGQAPHRIGSPGRRSPHAPRRSKWQAFDPKRSAGMRRSG
jgi:hypothetical protein